MMTDPMAVASAQIDLFYNTLGIWQKTAEARGASVRHPLAISLTCSSLERDFYRRRQTRKKDARGGVSKQRPEIGDHDAREMAGKTAFLPASYQLQVSGTGIFKVETARHDVWSPRVRSGGFLYPERLSLLADDRCHGPNEAWRSGDAAHTMIVQWLPEGGIRLCAERVYICGPDNLTSRSARKTLPYRLPIHCLPLEVTFR
jgi:hypothetical protein